jgi:hypothetical protein
MPYRLPDQKQRQAVMWWTTRIWVQLHMKSLAGGEDMATQKQSRTARRNITKAQRAARRKKTITKLPKETRRDLGRQAAKARKRRRGQISGSSYENRSRQELYQIAKRKDIPGRSKMGKWDLIRALRNA